MTKQIIFSTGNNTKLNEAIKTCAIFGIEIINEKLEIDEIQSHDPFKISLHKANQAYEMLKQPVIVNDSYWSITALNGFPGGYMKDVLKWFTTDDFLNLMHSKDDRSVCITDCVVYKDKDYQKIISKDFWGELSVPPHGNGNAIENITVFNDMTLSEHYGLKRPALKSDENIWNDFAKWFSEYEK